MCPLPRYHPFRTVNGGHREHLVNSTPVINLSAFTLRPVKVNDKK